jgi:hypothetical protein
MLAISRKLLVVFVLYIFINPVLFAEQGPGSNLGKNVPITGNVSQLKYFFQGLNEAKTKKIHIAHFGDSIIEGDVITSDLRDFFQKKFGGNGAGLVAICPEDAPMRKTTKCTSSDDWKEASIFKRNPNNWPYGINASAFVPSDKSWAKFEITALSKTLKSFSNATLLYKGGSTGSKINYSFNNGGDQSVNLAGGNNVKTLELKSNHATSLKLGFDKCSSAYFYGVSLDNGNGVYFDNIPIKGNSGISLVDIPQDVLKDFNKLLNYKLIILNFGINVLSPTYTEYSWYEKKMEKVIEYFKQAFPQTSILLVSVGDKGIKKGSKFVTDPQIPMLLEAQKNVASKTGIAFWNLYEAMGGENSVSQWVTAGPPLAFKDYCHLTGEGGEKVAELLSNALMSEYNKQK